MSILYTSSLNAAPQAGSDILKIQNCLGEILLFTSHYFLIIISICKALSLLFFIKQRTVDRRVEAKMKSLSESMRKRDSNGLAVYTTERRTLER